MVLFVSDMHLGLDSSSVERAIEERLVSFLASFEQQVTHLYLVGDIFDGYIEYRRLVPKGFVRFLALLAAWTDRGIGVTYLEGNHDLWHRDYFATELGIRVRSSHVMEKVEGVSCYVRHGDGLGRAGRAHRVLRTLMTSDLLVWLYRTILPADFGLALAQTVSRHLHARPNNPRAADDMRQFARDTLKQTAARIHVMGHSHNAELCVWPEGVYMNLGSWREGGFFGLLKPGRIQLMRWHSGRAEIVKEHAV